MQCAPPAPSAKSRWETTRRTGAKSTARQVLPAPHMSALALTPFLGNLQLQLSRAIDSTCCWCGTLST